MIKGKMTIKIRKYFNLSIVKMHYIIRSLKKVVEVVPLYIRGS